MLDKKTFIQSEGLRRLALFEYISELENQGLNDIKIQAKLLEDRIVKSARVLNREWNFYNKVKTKVAWR